MKSEVTIFRTTKEQKDFLLKQSDIEERTITAMVNIALGEKYPEYMALLKKQKGVKNNEK